MNAPVRRIAAVAADTALADPLYPLTDEQIARMVKSLRSHGWGHPMSNPAADALVSLFALVMEADPDEAHDRANEVATGALNYARLVSGKDAA